MSILLPMDAINHPHDHFFQHSFARREVAADFLTHYLPEPVRRLLDLQTLELTKDSFVDEALQDHFSDLLYKLRLRDGSLARVYLLFEHKSYPASLVAFQLLRYMVRIWEEMLREEPEAGLRPIIPLVLYHGRTQWHVHQNFGSLLQGPEELRIYWPEFNYELYDLTGYSDADLVGAAMLQVTLQVMKHVFTGELAQRLPGILQLLQELTRQQSGLEFLYTVLRYVSQTGRNVTAEDIRQAVVTVFPVEGAVLMATAAEQWLEQGKVLGKQEGKQEGLMAAIELGLELKFGAAGLALLPMVRQVQNTEVLRTLAESIKTTQTLTELRTLYAALATPAA
ncbi:MAG: Rpn family recombination-promoting nuclease/putative transposase [Caldilineaceae bacterium]